MQRIPSGVTDQYIYFLAVDSTDLKTPETGLSSFTVRRSRNGNASAAFTTPTINETDSSNMPGWYELLMDEDTTIDSGDDSQVMALHITQASMAPARVLIELYRPAVTPGQQLTVSSGSGNAAVQSIANNALTAAAINADAFTAAKFAADVTTELQAGLATASALSTLSGKVDVIDDFLDTEIAAIKAKTDNLPSDPADASDIATAFSGVNTKLDTIDDFLDTEVAAIKAKTDSLTFTVTGKVDANITHVNEIEVTGNGEPGTEWGPA